MTRRATTAVSMVGLLAGAGLSAAVALFVAYGEGFAWAASGGLVLGLDLVPTTFTIYDFVWPFVVALGLGVLAATACLPLLVAKWGPSALVGAASVGVVVLLAAHIARSMSQYASVTILNFPQRLGYFLSESSAYVVFVGAAVLLLLNAYAGSKRSSRADRLPEPEASANWRDVSTR